MACGGTESESGERGERRRSRHTQACKRGVKKRSERGANRFLENGVRKDSSWYLNFSNIVLV